MIIRRSHKEDQPRERKHPLPKLRIKKWASKLDPKEEAVPIPDRAREVRSRRSRKHSLNYQVLVSQIWNKVAKLLSMPPDLSKRRRTSKPRMLKPRLLHLPTLRLFHLEVNEFLIREKNEF